MIELASDSTKTALENAVYALLADRMAGSSMPITTKKYLTNDNNLVYLTQCNVAETAIPRVRVQVLKRVAGGVHETNYSLYVDQRLESTENPMIFGEANQTRSDETPKSVDDATAVALIEMIGKLPEAQQRLS